MRKLLAIIFSNYSRPRLRATTSGRFSAKKRASSAQVFHINFARSFAFLRKIASLLAPVAMPVCAVTTFILLPLSLQAAPAKVPVIDIRHWQSKNGAKVYFVRAKELPMVDINVVFAAGAAYDGSHAGVSYMTNALIGEGSRTRNADQIADAFDDVGAKISTHIDKDMAQVSLRSLSDSDYFDKALAVFKDVLAHAQFSQKDFDRMKNSTLVVLKAQQQQPSMIADQAFYRYVYANHPYAHPSFGTEASVKKMTRKTLERFYQQYYVASNAKVFIVGNLTEEQAKQTAETLLADLPKGKPAIPLAQASSTTQSQQHNVKYPSKQATIFYGQTGVNRHNPQYFSLIVGNGVLGGSPLNSILFRQVRDSRGLAYYAGSTFVPLKLRGPFAVQMQTKASNTDESLTLVKKILRDFVSNGPTNDQLDLIKQSMINSFPLTLATNKALMSAISLVGFYDLPLDYLDHYTDNVAAVTQQSVKKAFQDNIQPDKMVTVIVGPVS